MTLSKTFKASGLLSTPEVARELGVTRGAVWLFIKSGSLKAQRIGGWLGVTREALDEYRGQVVTISTVSGSTPGAKPRGKAGKAGTGKAGTGKAGKPVSPKGRRATKRSKGTASDQAGRKRPGKKGRRA